MRHFLLLPLFISLTSPAQSEIDPKVREACLPAADFLGCVKAYTTESTDIQNLRVIQGKTELTGNSCPSGFGYSGAGYCTNVICADRFRAHPDLRGKAWKGCIFYSSWWGNKVIKAVVDPKCPLTEPIIGTPSSCTTQEDLDQIKAKKNKKPLACKNGVWDENHPKCKDAGITSPMDMD